MSGGGDQQGALGRESWAAAVVRDGVKKYQMIALLEEAAEYLEPSQGHRGRDLRRRILAALEARGSCESEV